MRGFLSLGHTHAIYVPPPVGGLFLDSEAIDAITGGPFLIDHDQKLQAQGQLLWDIGTSGVWLGANVRYDSGLVTDAIPDELAPGPQRLLRGALRRRAHAAATSTRTASRRGRSRASPSGWTSRATACRSSLQADLLNAFDTQGVYNIQSVFGGTHVIPPRTFAVRLRYTIGGAKKS